MSQEIPQEIFDSLPYFDNDLDTYPHLRVKVDEELQREQAKTKNAEKGLHPKIGEAFLLFKVRILPHLPAMLAYLGP